MRTDFYLYNDAGSWSVVAGDAVANIIEDYRNNDAHFVLGNKLALFAIEGDDYSVIRVVLNEPLTDVESAEWIAKASWRLKVDGNQILICGGFDPDCLSDWQATGDSSDIKTIDIATGDYQVVLYSYLHSMNGAVWAYRRSNRGLLPQLSSWFRQDHPNTPLPSWLAALFAYDDVDPQDEWYPIRDAVKSGRITVTRQPLHWIGYLVHIMPFTEDMELNMPEEDGWFEPKTGFRVPEQCPLGIASDCTEDTDIISKLNWILGIDS